MMMFKLNKLLFVTICTVLLYGIGVTGVVAKDYSFSWSANAEPVEGYKLYYKQGGTAGLPFGGTDATEGVSPIDLGKVTSFTITGLEDNTTYHFALTAYNESEESDLTNVITVFPDGSPVSPVAVVSASVTSGEAPLTVNFNGNGSTSVAPPISSYNWNFGDNTLGSGASVDHVYSLPGSYAAVLTVEDSNGVSEEVSTTITVAEATLPDPPVADLSASVTTGPVPLNVTFTGSGSTGTISSYSWVFGDNSSVGSGESLTHTYDVAGNYSVILTVSDAAGQTSQQSVVIVATDAVSAGASYPFSWSANAEPVEGYKLYYKKGGSAGPPFDGNDATEGVSPIDLGKVTTFAITGLEDNTTYHFALTAYNGSEESDFTDVITVFPDGSPDPLLANISADRQTGEAPFTVNFDASSSTGSITEYSWAFGEGGTGAGSSASYTYQNPGTYTAVLTVEDGVGQVEQASVDITVLAAPATDPPVAVMSTSLTSGEAPLTVNFNGNGSTSVAPPISSYNWNFGDNTIGSGISVDHVYSLPGSYTAVLTVEDSNGVSEEVNTTITVIEATLPDPPVANLTASVLTGPVPLNVTFTGSGSTGTISSYSWNFGDNSSAGSGESLTHTYDVAGNYSVILTVSDAAGQTSQQSVVIVATDAVSAGVSYPFSWSANAEPVEGYKLYYKKGGSAGPPFDGADATEGVSPIDLGKVTSFTITGLEDNTTYHFALTAYNGSEESDFTDVITVFPDGSPDPLLASISVDSQTGEVPLHVVFDGSGSTGAVSSYLWNFGDGDVAEGVNVSHIYNSTGSYTATLVTSDTDGATSQESVEIDVVQLASGDLTPPVAVISPAGAEGVAPFTTSFNGGESSCDPDTSIGSYEWDFGDGSDTQSGISVEHYFSQPATYTVSLTVTDNAGQTDETVVFVNVSTASAGENTAPIAQFSKSSSSGVGPLYVSFDGFASSDPDGDLLEYVWSFGDGATAAGEVSQHTYNDPGVYTVELFVEDEFGATASSSQTITVLTVEEYGLLKKKRAQVVNIIINMLLLDEKESAVLSEETAE